MLADKRPGAAREELSAEVDRIMRNRPAVYLADLADLLDMPFFLDADWLEFAELVATRNVLVHRTDPVADDMYARQAGTLARAAVGDALGVDDQYLLHAYAITTDLGMRLLWKVIGAPDGGPGAVGPGDERHG